jgi:uncharacterized membrane protein YfcA
LLDLCIAATGLVVGLLVGLTSIGGVLVVPVLVVLLGLSPHDAIPAAMASFVAPTAMALLLVHRRGELDLRACAASWLGAAPGALAGAALLPLVPIAALLGGITAMLAASALRVFLRPPMPAGTGFQPPRRELALAGLAVGAISALTGTGGPVALMPILGWRGVDPRRAVMLCQGIALPVTGFASLGFAFGAGPDWRLVGLLAASTTLGVVLGMRAAPRVATHALSRLIGAMMAVAAAVIAARLVLG